MHGTGFAILIAVGATLAPEDDVRRTVLDFAERWTHAETPEEIAAFYSEDGTHINPQGEWVRARDNLVGYFEPLVSNRGDNFSADFTIENIELITEDVALVDGSIRIRGMRERELFERFSFVMRKSAERWEIAASRVMFPESR